MFHVDRAAAMTAYFLEKAGGRINDIKLAKLQYIAERISLLRNSTPLTGDACVSLNHGPCLSETLWLSNDTKSDPLWDEHIAFTLHDPETGSGENDVILLRSFNYDDFFNESDMEILNSVWNGYGHMDKWNLRKWCHETFGEYVEVGPNGYKPITLEEIFRAEGYSPENAKVRAEDIRHYERMRARYGYDAAS